MTNPQLSPSSERVALVIPCFNEEQRFDGPGLIEFLDAHPAVEAILVNDGSQDGTRTLLNDLVGRRPDQVTALHLEDNRGKAEAVREGMRFAFRRPSVFWAGYWDADMATPLSALRLFVSTMRRRPQTHVVLGSRVQLLGRTIERKTSRHYLGRVFATVASLVLSLPVYDTQCGAKLFRNIPEVRQLFERPFDSRWIFDVELLARFISADPSRRSAIFELPLDEWRDVAGSKVKGTDFVRAIGETLTIYRNYRLPTRYQGLFDILTAPFVRYVGVGALGTVMHYLVLALSVELLGTSPGVGAALGATVGALVNYIINYHFTFVSEQSHKSTLPKFLTVAALGAAVSWATVEALATKLGVHYLLGQATATLLVLVLGFLLNLAWTFKSKKASPPKVDVEQGEKQPRRVA